MQTHEAKQRIEKLKEQIRKLNYQYFVLNKSEVSEAVRDSLKKELKELEGEFPQFITPDSPTQRVGSALSGKFAKVRHLTPKKSLDDVFSEEELKEWEERIAKFTHGEKISYSRPSLSEAKPASARREREASGSAGAELKKLMRPKGATYICELKIDGLNITLHYEKGRFARALTRGNGIEGEDVTHAVKTIECIPLELNEEVDLEVSGEVFMSKKSFERINAEQKKHGEELFANPRNAAAGTVRQLDPKITASRELSAFFYELGKHSLAKAPETQEAVLKAFQKLGLPVNREFRVVPSSDGVISFYKHWHDKREKLAYEIDGIVVKVNERRLCERMGFTAKTPRWAVAYKFSAQQATTKVENIIVQVGRTGALTPVAILKPTFLAGSTISRATLHNKDEMAKKDVRIGDTVVIQKAGDVIPEVVEVLKKLRSGRERKFHFPAKCPVCGSRAEKPEGEAITRCTNTHCFARQRESLIHFAGKYAFDINGLGEKVVLQLIDVGLVSDAADFFKLAERDFLGMPLFKEKRAGNLVAAIEKAKHVSLSRFLFSLSIRHIGEGISQDLAKFILARLKKTKDITPIEIFEIMQAAEQEEINAIEGFGDIVANSAHEFFHIERTHALFKKLTQAGVRIFSDISEKKVGLSGKNIVVTGTLKSFTREEMKDAIKRAGGISQSDVSAKTDYLVCGEDPGSKFERAKKAGVKIIDEKDFMELLK